MLTVLVVLLPGVVIGYILIAQWPEEIFQRVGDTVNISCNQKNSDLAYMFWYQQPQRNGLKLIVSTTSLREKFYEDGYSEAKFEISRKYTYTVMTIKNVTSKDVATYFCAASDHTFLTDTTIAQGKEYEGDEEFKVLLHTDDAHKTELMIQQFVTVNSGNMIFGDGTKLTVIEKDKEIIPPSVAIFSPSKQEIQQKNKATLVCLASGFYPDHLTLVWMVNDVKRTKGVGTDEFSTQNGSTYTLTSRLRIAAWEWFNPLNNFECVANFFQSGKEKSIHKVISGDAGCAVTEDSYLRYGNSVKLTYFILCGKALIYAVLVSSLLWRAKVGGKLYKE
ncbi:immunoglobulin lambda-1 light chain-like [Neopelma chrysocephalum]|uniref:immunoglobulin lambda-1 light chain-like n=1 Tax=Neopelma chrysocephalum TaxID=114329 RepID=UPI000FCD0039|nr:immunoglobulin lambda-1 light chain-like [Neopelma chrysocephalum]